MAARASRRSDAVRLINREKAVLIDVSEPAEFAAGHAVGAKNVPLGQPRAEARAQLPKNKSLPLLVSVPDRRARAARGGHR